MSPESGVERINHAEEVMGTVVTFDLFVASDTDRSEIHLTLSRARASLHRADAIFSTWKPNSPMSLLRRGETTLADAPVEIADVLSRCEDARDLTNGLFDPWALPGGVDPTGYVKGWAAQRALDLFRPLPLIGAIVNAAGDIACFGAPEPDGRFRFGIVDPGARGRLAAIAEIDAALATSGTQERGEHLFDPRTGSFHAMAASASVAGKDLGLADALATALCVEGEEGLALLEELPDYEAYLVTRSGEHRYTSNFPFADDTRPDTPR